jgi:hypothetical protein
MEAEMITEKEGNFAMHRDTYVIHHKNGHWWSNHNDLYPMLGLKSGNPIPKDLDFIKTIRVGTELATYWVRPHNGGKHRVFCRCIACNKWIPFGRVGQHVLGKTHLTNLVRQAGFS